MKYTINTELNKANKKGYSSILFRLRVNNKRITIASSIMIPEKDWNNKNKTIKRSFENHTNFNRLLKRYASELEEALNKAELLKEDPTKEYLINSISFKNQDSTKNDIEKYFEEFLHVKKVIVSKSTMDKYEYTYRAVKLVAKKNGIELSFKIFNDIFYSHYLDYLFNTKNLQSNGANSYVKNLKVFLEWCTNMGYNRYLAFKKFKVPKFEPDIFPLTEDEIKLLERYETTGGKEKVRNIFLFQTYTGLRFGDALALKPQQITGSEINLRAKKTKQNLFIPLTNKAMDIVNKYRHLPEETDGYILPRFTNQKANKYLKALCEEIGLDREIIYHKCYGKDIIKETGRLYEKVSSHDARRTFITFNLTKGMNAQMIMAMTGHKNFKTFERYVRFNEKDITKLLNNIWND